MTAHALQEQEAPLPSDYVALYNRDFVRLVHSKRKEAKQEAQSASKLNKKELRRLKLKESAQAVEDKYTNDTVTVEELRKMSVDEIITHTIKSEGISRKAMDSDRGNVFVIAVRRLAVVRVYRAYGHAMPLTAISSAFNRPKAFARTLLIGAGISLSKKKGVNVANGQFRGSIRTSSTCLQQLFKEADKRGIPMKEIASQADCTTGNISCYRAGVNTPSVLRVEEMVAALGGRIVIEFPNEV